VLKNWYYVNVIEISYLRWLGYSISFATVLPGIFETFELLETTALLKKWLVKPRRFSRATHKAIVITGIISLILPVLYPRYCFPLVWCAFVLLLDPINYRWKAPSLLTCWENGNLRKPVLLMASGLICGVFWEFWNYWAATKWIYTVPFFEAFKVFEMTSAGFLGFIPFALECYVMVTCIYLLRKPAGWEQDTVAIIRSKRIHLPIRFVIILFSITFSIGVFKAIDRTTVDSYRPFIRDMTSIDTDNKFLLEQCGIIQVKGLLKLKSSEDALLATVQCASVNREELMQWISDAEMIMLKGMGIHNFLLLKRANISSIAALAAQDPHALRITLENNNTQRNMIHYRIPDEAKLKLWIQAAQRAISRDQAYVCQ
jgi:hypothetical protein